MPTIRLSANAVTCSIPRSTVPTPPVRTAVTGWTRQASKRNRDFLQSVQYSGLTGRGYALTLTVRDCPASPEDWHRLRTDFFKRMRRLGMLRAHWVVEMQRRKVPHLHVAIYFPDSPCPGPGHVISHWLEVAGGPYGALFHSQRCDSIHSPLGWMKYLAKHAARSVHHYQRDRSNMPPTWSTSGRLWGHLGDWPTLPDVILRVDDPGYFRYRRYLRLWALAQARAVSDWPHVRFFRGMLNVGDRKRSSVRSINQWIPREHSVALARHMAAHGLLEILAMEDT